MIEFTKLRYVGYGARRSIDGGVKLTPPMVNVRFGAWHIQSRKQFPWLGFVFNEDYAANPSGHPWVRVFSLFGWVLFHRP